jgi:hypothetical protein
MRIVVAAGFIANATNYAVSRSSLLAPHRNSAANATRPPPQYTLTIITRIVQTFPIQLYYLAL